MAFSAGSAFSTVRAARRSRRPHLFQLLHLFERQDLRKLRLYFGLQLRQLLLLVGGQFQLLSCAGRQKMKPAAWAAWPVGFSAGTTGVAGRASARRRTLPVRMLIGILRCDEAG